MSIPTLKSIAYSEVLSSWIDLGIFISSNSAGRNEGSIPSFMDQVWKFDLTSILKILEAEAEPFLGFRSIAFSGVCTWIICPNDLDLIHDAMMHKGRLIIRNAEKRGRKLFPGNRLFGEMAGRTFLPGLRFYEDFYFPVNKERSWTHLSSRGQHRATLKRHAAEVLTVVDLMKVFHWHVAHLLQDSVYDSPSLNKDAECLNALSKISKSWVNLTTDTIDNHWKRRGQAAALQYAASTIMVGPNISLLDAIIKNDVSYRRHARYFMRCLEIAKFISQDVLSHLPNSRFTSSDGTYLHSGNLSLIPPPDMTKDEQAAMKNTLRKKKPGPRGNRSLTLKSRA